MFCSNCGKQAEGDFCWNCGAKLFIPHNDNVSNQSKKIVQEKILVPFSSFRADITYTISTGLFEIDNIHQIMRFMPHKGDEGIYFHFQDIFDAELVQNGSSVFKASTSSMITRAILGSAIGNGFGIIAGATAKKNEHQYIDELYVRVMLKNTKCPVAKIPFITGRIPRNSHLAETAMENIETVLTQIKLAQSTPVIDTAYTQNSIDFIVKPINQPSQSVSTGNQNWRCPECDYSNKGTVSTCFSCGALRPVAKNKIGSANTIPALPSSDNFGKEDWFCPKCDLKNKATNKTCPNCGTIRPVPGQEKTSSKKGLLGLFKK